MAIATSFAEMRFTGERIVPTDADPDLWNEHLSRYLFAASLAAGTRALDIGCGAGYGTEILAAAASKAVGCDISEEAVNYAASRGSKARYFVASASALPFSAGCLDFATAFEVIEHVADWEGLIAESARVLSADGVLVVSTPNKLYYAETREEVGPNPFHKHEFELEEFRESLRRSFPFVQIFGQNHQQSVVFSSGATRVDGRSFVPAMNDLSNAHFFVALCSKQRIEVPPFAYIPSAANLLRERDHYLRLLQAELKELNADRDHLLAAHRRLHSELEEQNSWARRLDRELLARVSELKHHTTDAEKLLAELEVARSQASALQGELDAIKKSFWLRIGGVLDIGPWTEGRLHLNRVYRFVSSKVPIVAFLRLLSHVLKVALATVLLLISAVLFACEDLCFLCFGKRRLFNETKVSHQSATVVITNWNGRALLERFLPSVITALAPNKNNEIIVVDNASSDGSVEFVQTHFPGVRALALDRNVGFGGGSNAGVTAAANDVVILLNNDMQVDRHFLLPLLEPFADPLVFAVSSQVFFADPTKRREETGLTEVWWDHGMLKAGHRIDPHIDVPYPCAYPGGGSSAFDRRKFLELGGFDPLFAPFYYEDTDMGFLAWKRGWKVLYQPASIVHHLHRATISKSFSEDVIQRVLNKNVILYCWKNIHNWKMMGGHLAACLLDCSRSQVRAANQCRAKDVFRSFGAIRAAMKSRWLALSKAKISDQAAFTQPLGGYFRDRFVAPLSPPPARLRVLFASPYPIEPPIHGGGVLMKQTLNQLTKLADIHLVSFLDNECQLEDQHSLRSLCKSVQCMVRRPVSELSLTMTPLPVRQFADRDFSWLVHRTMLLEEIDVVQIEYTMLGQYAGNYQHIPCLLFEHDVFSQTLRRGLKRGGMSTKALIEYLRMRVYEPRLITRVTRVQVCSHANADYLKRLAPKIRNVDPDMRAAIDTSHYSMGTQQRDLTSLLFVGGFNHSPNTQGLRWFIIEVFDRILAKRPDVTLEIVGAHPPPGPNIWDEHSSIRFVGSVSDVREPLRRAGVFICPILSGSGIRVKLLEAFASEIPVVSTTIGAEGLASQPGVVCEIADTPEAFARSVILLLENQIHRTDLVERARLMVERERNSREATARLESSYRHEVLKVRPRTIAKAASA